MNYYLGVDGGGSKTIAVVSGSVENMFNAFFDDRRAILHELAKLLFGVGNDDN